MVYNDIKYSYTPLWELFTKVNITKVGVNPDLTPGYIIRFLCGHGPHGKNPSEDKHF